MVPHSGGRKGGGGPAPAGDRPSVGVIMGSASDLPVARQAADILRQMGIPYEMTVASAHRSPDRVVRYAREARGRGLKVIIALAGGAAHLAGVAAAFTTLPVIGVPVQAWSTAGLDSLLSMAQMPRGVPVATVAVDGGANAALLAARILALSDGSAARAVEKYQAALARGVEEADEQVRREIGGGEGGSP